MRLVSLYKIAIFIMKIVFENIFIKICITVILIAIKCGGRELKKGQGNLDNLMYVLIVDTSYYKIIGR